MLQSSAQKFLSAVALLASNATQSMALSYSCMRFVEVAHGARYLICRQL